MVVFQGGHVSMSGSYGFVKSVTLIGNTLESS